MALTPVVTRTRAADRCSEPPLAVRRASLLFAGFLVLASCGGDTPGGPSGPKPGGTITGRYTLEITPVATCRGSRTLSVPVEVTSTGSAPHPGVQLLRDSPDTLGTVELELKYEDNTLEGGIGTTGDGAQSAEGPWFWVNAVASGKATQASDGRGEVVSGTLRGYVEIDGVTDACSSTAHSFTLRSR